jgi:D-threo-aldose 1-dehydrogenase
METITLGTSGRQTTRLGFGGSSIMGALGRRASLAMLESAWDAGIRHFDVAPMYGYGQAESCLGEFIQHHRGQVTVTTKYGIPPEPARPVVRMARSVMRPIVQKFPGLKKRLARVDASTTAAPAETDRPTFTAEQARQSLERSLAALKTDHIDVWLLHDVTAGDLRDDSLLRLLEDSVQAGTIGTFGAGTDRNVIDTLLQFRPRYCPTLQYEWSVLNPVPQSTGSQPVFRIHHRALTNNFRSLHQALLSDRDRCQRWSETTAADLADREVLANLMLKAALIFNPASIVLFSSKNPAHIQANVAIASNDALTAPATSLYHLVQAERAGAG